MWDGVAQLSPAVQALLGTLFTWGMTALGAAVVFTTKSINQRLMDGMLGFAGGVMIAASFWSLLAPAIEMAGQDAWPAWFPATIGFLLGGFFLWGIDQLIPHLHPTSPLSEAEGIGPFKRKRSTLLVLAITLHNIPEGLAIGVAFGAVAADFPSASLTGAIALAIGIGIQNFPEGVAVALPLRRDGMSRRKSFFYGQLSAVVEPVAALFGVWAVFVMEPLLPFALSFAAGAMIFVVVEEVIPGSQENGHKDLASIALMLGFTVMMILDVALG
ncbi:MULTISPECIES: ZIP family metal transporter [unclassified Exiguobacterium]|uniref:ZIP family metal transporter n=1 Tax=unclassified Exiguobacterium TaxID=2644629 RepID=UPI00103F06FB|nr:MULTISPECIES: ZIP family metal transporter [unclassified Exiguobacterium]TCI48110.1 ZIP family metal transporter [Exiguobacterium sp. SH5S32]TCI54995.1 ZIP family metal transporter [Exiguobacterium sp. SH1S4]TCI63006.1 ZIP family metal transporter [Exiguobacterium sp. SH0S2]TCI74789.1 ZIP family metal transporter [Exiguobacterium sp. SH1S1]